MKLIDRIALLIVLSYAAAGFAMVASEHRSHWFVAVGLMPMYLAGGRLVSR